MAIQSFADKATEHFFHSGKVGKGIGWGAIQKVVARKLDMIHYAAALDDLKSPPSNRVEILQGSLKGFYSIRVNSQWRIVFRWSPAGPSEVTVCDYH